MKHTKSIITLATVMLTAFCLFRLFAAETSPAAGYEYAAIRWAGRDNTHIIRRGGQVEFVGAELRKAQKPDRTDDRAFYMNLVMNGLTKEGYEFAGIKAKIDRINNGSADGSLDVQEFKELKNPLVPQQAGLEQQIVALEKSKANRLEPLRNWVLEASRAEQWVFQNKWLELKSFLTRVGSNRLLRAQTLTVSFRKPFDLLAQTNRAVRSTHDVSEPCSRWWRRGELNPRP